MKIDQAEYARLKVIESNYNIVSYIWSSFREDAERYRWLRNTQNQRMRDNEEAGSIHSIFVQEDEIAASAPNLDELDRLIDLQMDKWPLVKWGRNAFTKGASTDVVVQGEDNDNS